MSDAVTVERTVEADPGVLWDLVADLPAMGRWSPENQGGDWIRGAEGPVVGARFKGANAHGRHRWNTLSTVAVADRPSEFAWEVTYGPFKVARWSFRFEADATSTRVTQTFTDRRSTFFAWVGNKATGVTDRAAHNRDTMERTLEALAAAVG
jgi:hypothetical protein